MKIYSCAVVFLTFSLSGCGDGSSDIAGGAGTPALSAAQKSYESMALSANGGLHYLQGDLMFLSNVVVPVNGSQPPPSGTIYSSSFFYSDNSSIPQTPANGPQPVSVAFTPVASTLALAALSGGARYLINGQVFSTSFPAQSQVSYTGGNVLESYFATDGKTVVHSLLGTSYTTIGLSGLIAGSPAELFAGSNVYFITGTLNGASLYNQQASWQSGATYMKVVRQVVGDTLSVRDCILPVTTGPNITPCSNTISTLEGFFPYSSTEDGLTYQISDGQIVTLAGVRAWVANPVSNGPTVQSRVYYQSKGGIYSGILIKDGTPLQIRPAGNAAPQNFYIFLNSAALQSIKSAINF